MTLKFKVSIWLIIASLSFLSFQERSSEKNTTSSIIEEADHWDFYWDRLLDPRDLLDSSNVPAKIKVPGSWSRSQLYPAQGKATYHKVFELPEDQMNYALYFDAINSASRIYVNGQLVDSIGSLSPNYQPRLKSLLVAIPPKCGNIDVLIQVENYTYFSGGLVRKPMIGKTDELLRIINRKVGVQNVLIGCLIALGVYQLILFFYNRKVKSHLCLSLLCLAVALRAATTLGGSFFLPEIFPSVEAEFWRKIEFFFVYTTVLLVPLYIKLVFKNFAPSWPFLLFVPTAIILCAMVMFTDQPTYGAFLNVYHAILLTTFVYVSYVIVKALKKNEPQAKVLRFGLFLCLPLLLLEILQNSKVISFNFYIPFLAETGLIAFLNVQVALLASQYSTAFKALESMNKNLEMIVADRTQELTRANTVKDKLLSIVSHDIKGPLQSLKGLFGLFKRKEISQADFLNLVDQVEVELAKTTLLVDNILTWTADQLKGVSVKKENFDLLALLELNIQLFQSVLTKKRINVKHNLTEPLAVLSDHSIINTVVRNIIANAIKFTNNEGLIEILVMLDEKILSLEIRDNGVGMDEKTLTSLANPQNTLSHRGTNNETGTGLGIMLCKELIGKLKGSLQIESKKNVGSKFIICIPVN